jgi:hypothetical protein
MPLARFCSGARGILCPRSGRRARLRAMLNDRDSLMRRLHELRSAHRDLDTVITELSVDGATDQLHLQRLKKRKLLLKDEISRLESRLIPDSIA